MNTNKPSDFLLVDSQQFLINQFKETKIRNIEIL